jgi:hypothetical protein
MLIQMVSRATIIASFAVWLSMPSKQMPKQILIVCNRLLAVVLKAISSSLAASGSISPSICNVETDAFDKLKGDMILNLFMASLPPHVSEFVKARTPETATDAACEADLRFDIKSSASDKHQTDDRPSYGARGSKLLGNDH